jgi:hypothetical protein
MTDSDGILDNVIAAHGGAGFWNGLSGLEAELSVDGFLFTTKRRRPLRRMRVWASTTEPRFVFHDYPRPGLRGELIGDDEVRIVDAAGTVIARRERPREAFRGLRRLFFWDDLDFLYFGGYATWNYLTAPFLFLRPGFSFERLPPLPGAEGEITRLRVAFPPDIPTHCRSQIFHFNELGHLLRLDYTAEVVGGWAHAAHLCEHYRDFDGLIAPTRRRVRPLFSRAEPLPFPTLVAIDLHALRPLPKDAGTPIGAAGAGK